MLKLQRSSAIEVYLRKAVLSLGLFCTVALFSAVFYSSIGVSGELNQATFADSSNSTSTISLRITKDGNDVTGLNLDLSPTATGAFVKDNLSLLVTTDNATGYKLDFSNTDDDTAMTHTSPATTASIPSITTTTDESSFPVNSWGYSLDAIAGAQTFSPIPTKSNPTTLKTTTAPSTNDQTDITFAIKADTNMPSGTYKDTVVFTAVANYVPNALEQISNMQDMTPQVCDAANVGDTATLKDSRDNKTYNIRKMEDGNCWMVQNLDLNLSSSVALTSENTNLITKSSWAPQNNTQTTEGTVWTGDGGDVARSMDPGNIYFPGGVGTGTADSYNNLQGATSGQPWEHIGNYYNWYAATAGTGTAAMTSGNATDSICPKGWKLPNNSGSKSFLNLITTTYGITDDAAGATKLLQAPLNFVRGGYYNWSTGQVYNKGTTGHWWSTEANAAPYAYYLYTLSARVSPQYVTDKGYGFTVRCVAESENLTTISTMQQMTSDICAATPTPLVSATAVPQATLRDVRDGNTYVVRKLADGNCWMTQNLNLTLSTSTALNSTTSDLSPGRTWTPQNNTQTAEGTAWAENGGDVARSMEPGEALYFPGGVGTGTADTYGNLAGATSGQPWEHVGNYYNWYASTAGTGTAAMTDGQTATDSICPKGWKLPDNTGNKSFLNLVATTYGITDDATGATKLLQAPLNFVRDGHYYWSNGQVYYKGAHGNWWSTATSSATYVYDLGTTSTRVIPQNVATKGNGLTVRCVAR